MALKSSLQNEIDTLSETIKGSVSEPDLYIERGKLHLQGNDFGKALNDFMYAQQLDPEDTEAREYISMIREILEYRYTDIYNP